MRCPTLLDHVCLTRAIPTLRLQCGAVGVVRSIWLSSPQFYEVEFRKRGESCAVRALVRGEDLEITPITVTQPALAGARS